MWSTVEGDRRFVDNWHVGTMCDHLEAVNLGQIRRLLINVPPRHQKSLTCNVFWPAWTWMQPGNLPLQGPQVRFLCATHTKPLTLRDSVKCRAVIESDIYQRRWSDRVRFSKDQNAKHRYSNTASGERLCASVGGKVIGEGGDIDIIDDPQDPSSLDAEGGRERTLDWWRYEMSTRLNDPSYGAFVAIMQRLHQQDFSGFVLDSGDWVHLCLPARFETDHPHRSVHDIRQRDGELLWPQFATEEFIDQQEKELGSYGFAGQFQQRPAPRSGGMFDRTNWGYVDAVPAGGETVRGWDLAGTDEARGKRVRAAYTAGCKMTRVNGEYYIEDMRRFRASPAKVVSSMKNIASEDGHAVTIDFPQDPGQAGKAQAQYLAKELAGYNARYSTETGAKEVRAEALSAQQEAGNVHLLRGPWNEDFVNEGAFFPNSEYTDQIDAASRAFHRLLKRGRSGRVAMTPPEIVNSEA